MEGLVNTDRDECHDAWRHAGYLTQYVFLVRHPLYTIASLLDWCLPSESRLSAADETCHEFMSRQRLSGGTNLLFYRIYASPDSGDVAGLCHAPNRDACELLADYRPTDHSDAPNHVSREERWS